MAQPGCARMGHQGRQVYGLDSLPDVRVLLLGYPPSVAFHDLSNSLMQLTANLKGVTWFLLFIIRRGFPL